ncbi:MAG: hypothetical protein Kow00109_27390 [Acidobacteriota bacterium]
MRTCTWLMVTWLPAATLLNSTTSAAVRWIDSFDEGWRFLRGEAPAEVHELGFDDSGWESIRLPHDWAIRGPFDPQADGYAGKLPWRGLGWYRKIFPVPAADQGHRYLLIFDGVMAFPAVYVNGAKAGEWDYGYTPFWLDITPYLRFGGENVLVVRVDTRQHGTRWYPGAGIYRKARLAVVEAVHLAPWGVGVRTDSVTDDEATISVEVAVRNTRAEAAPATVAIRIFSPGGSEVASAATELLASANAETVATGELAIPHPQLWDVEEPNLYTCEVTLRGGGEAVEVRRTRFGIRTFRFTADDGFHLNGRRLQLKGVNLHHDQGPLGAAFYLRAAERQLEIMRDMGVNAIRTSHNPPAAELLDLCDRMGFIVWDELFDKWDATADRLPGVPFESFVEKHVRNFVLRDRNHPSVVVWSIGNEITAGGEGVTRERVQLMVDLFRKYDPTRPIGMGCHIPSMVDGGYFEPLDLTGWNYLRRYARFRERYPDKPIVYSESASALSTRDFYDFPLPRRKTEYSDEARQVTSYDFNAAPWADIPDVEFQLMQRDRFVAGEFVWTGFDYLGEPTPYSADARSSYFGIVDLAGIPKDRYFLYRSYWRPEATTVYIVPHWTWPDRAGQVVPVFVYTNGDSAELFLNGRSLGVRRKGEVPARPPAFTLNAAATASSEAGSGTAAPAAVDGNPDTFWAAAEAGGEAWWQVDLGGTRKLRFVRLLFPGEEKNYGVDLYTSPDGDTWTRAGGKPASDVPRWSGPREAFVDLDTEARHLRIVFTELRRGARPELSEVDAYAEVVENPYYDATYHYRLRWNDVVYQPGELKAIAYRDGRPIGEAVVRTAGPAQRLHLTADRTILQNTGDDLAYVLVEALDAAGNRQPWAEHLVRFSVTGPAEITGVGNGNPLSLEPFVAPERRLFYGRAMLILRALRGRVGPFTVTAAAGGLQSAQLQLQVAPVARE